MQTDLQALTKLIAMRNRETTDRTIRYVEDLDLARERAAVTQDELTNRQAERMNQNMYLLAIRWCRACRPRSFPGGR